MATFAAILWLLKNKLSLIALDRPNPRSLHGVPVPRTGGLGLMAGVFAGGIFLGLPWPLWAGVVILIAVSVVDDIYNLPAVWRLLAHFAAAALAMAYLLFGSFGLPLTLLAVVITAWMTNLYNFMDGSDGLAGGMAVFGFGFYGIAAWISGDEIFALVNFSIAASAMAFLLFNFHPARIFLGDAGSIPLGYLAATLGSMGWLQNEWPVWFPLLVFSPFIMDASVTLAKRALKRKKVWQAHREHYYQRLVQIGWGHRKTAWFEYGLMLAAGASALWAIRQDTLLHYALLVCWGVFYLLAMIIFDRYWLKDQQNAST
ncbi:MAG TPA: glycosyltransferase family 4 protein [Burkholderiales bacterium]|nr:glycosyltransferase family 4 protein [Burkholderiales bacterium]